MKSKIIIISLGLLFNYPALADDLSYQQQIVERAAQERPYWQAKSIEVSKGLQKLNNSDLKELVKEPTTVNLAFFPVQTSVMTPGSVKAQKMELNQLTTPIFIIGSDATSKDWLKRHVDKLKELHAIGFLVEVASQTELDAIKTMVGSIPLVPISGNALAERFKLAHYPVLISQNGIEQ